MFGMKVGMWRRDWNASRIMKLRTLAYLVEFGVLGLGLGQLTKKSTVDQGQL